MLAYLLHQLLTSFIYLNKKIIVTPILFLLLSLNLFGENNNAPVTANRTIDSLLTIIKKDKADTNKVKHIYIVTDEFRKIGDVTNGLKYATDGTLLSEKLNFKKGSAEGSFNIGNQYYINAEYSKALVHFYKALFKFEALNNKKEIARCYTRIGIIYTYQADYNKASSNLLKALKIAENLNNKSLISDCWLSIGNVYLFESNKPMALSYYLKALKIYEELKSSEQIIKCINNIGTIYQRDDNYEKALVYYLKALKLNSKFGSKKQYTINLINIGNIYLRKEDTPSALDYYFNALEKLESTDTELKPALYMGIGSCFLKRKLYPKALDYYFKGLKTAENLGDKNLIGASLMSIGNIYFETGNYTAAEKCMKEAINIATSIGAEINLADHENDLANLYTAMGQYQKALIHYKKSAELKDSIFSKESRKQLVQKEMTYEFDKKAGILKAENEKQQAIAEQKARVQNIIIWSVSGGLLLAFIFAGLIFRSLYVTRKQKNIIEQQRNEVSKQKEIADSQRIIAEELRIVAEKQREVVQEKQKEIVDSITYAKRIQTALLTSDEYIKEHLQAEHFILFKPKDIVSGDFYWALNLTQIPGWDLGINSTKKSNSFKTRKTFYLVTADCTGHGVPGAFMSMLNIAYLNENVIERSIRLPNDILNAQRKEIIKALNPQGSTKESKDGMDCVLCAYDFDKMLLHFAAANNPLWLIRKGELIEYKADKMPVGKYDEVLKPFTLQTIELQKDDIIYTSTDGFADQFGSNGKKLMKKRFKEELLAIQDLQMNEQKEHLDNFFESWKGNNEQVDDVCVIGVKI